MQILTINHKQAGKKLERVLRDHFTNMPANALYKAFRKKDIKVNGIRIKEDYIAIDGDYVEVYIVDEILFGSPKNKDESFDNQLNIVFEDKNIMIINKKRGVPVHPDRDQKNNTLIDMVKDYLIKTEEFNPNKEGAFVPSLCHRLDRNTGGLIIIAKNEPSLKAIINKLKNNEIKKYYQCLVFGKMDKNSDTLKAYLEKDENKSQVYVSDEKKPYSVEIITKYRVLSYENYISRLEIELVTGRTHQIRAHLAFIGHPIVGDGKYGTNSQNKALKAKIQELWSYKLYFDFNSDAGPLNYLKGKQFKVEPEFSVSYR